MRPLGDSYTYAHFTLFCTDMGVLWKGLSAYRDALHIQRKCCESPGCFTRHLYRGGFEKPLVFCEASRETHAYTLSSVFYRYREGALPNPYKEGICTYRGALWATCIHTFQCFFYRYRVGTLPNPYKEGIYTYRGALQSPRCFVKPLCWRSFLHTYIHTYAHFGLIYWRYGGAASQGPHTEEDLWSFCT